MTTDQTGRGSPWLSVWLKPRVTIEGVIANYRTRWILVLAALNAIFSVVNLMITEGRMGAGLIDWRVLVGITLGVGALGVGYLYLAGLFFKWSGRLFRGHATAAELRAVIAWGGAPYVMGLAVVFAIVIGLRLAGVLSPFSQGAELTREVIAFVFAIWSLAASLLMLSRVQKFGFWRTIVSYALGYT
jgi:signal peptidase I